MCAIRFPVLPPLPLSTKHVDTLQTKQICITFFSALSFFSSIVVNAIRCPCRTNCNKCNKNGFQPCYTQGCTRRVSHGWANNASSSSTGEGGANGNGVVMSCLLHAQQGMTQMRGVACEFPGCQINPSYALKVCVVLVH